MCQVAVVAMTAVLATALSWVVLDRPAWSSPQDPPGRSPVRYRPPLDAEVVDAFRAPATDWAAGNRGLDYGSADGDLVSAAADGQVVFAGNVGGSQHVVVLHADGVRTSYSFLRSSTAARGDRIRTGDQVGVAGGRLHFGARIGDAYVDPALLLADDPLAVHLVVNTDPAPLSEAGERGGLLRMLDRTVSALLSAGAPRFDELAGLVEWMSGVYPVQLTAEATVALGAWWDQRDDCTPSDTSPPPLGTARRIMVQVAGLGSTSGAGPPGAGPTGGAVFDVDASSLGYQPDDVVRFSYRGGSTAENGYEPVDTTVDLRDSARRLNLLLADIAQVNPGVPIDIVAHSQGGLVARWAITDESDGGDPRQPEVSNLVTLGTPHHGSNAATTAAMLGHSGPGLALRDAADGLVGFDPGSTSVQQLAEHSEFIERLNRRPLPDHVQVTSIAARADLIVPARQSQIDGARNVVVSVPADGLDHAQAHDRLPGSDPAYREISLALAGLPPTCQGFFDAVADAVVPEGIAMVEDRLGLAAWAGARSLEVATVGTAP